MTLQEIFDKVRTHLLTQGEQCAFGGNCKYRGDNGKMCAVGCLIPDALYNPEIEDVGVRVHFQKLFRKAFGGAKQKILHNILKECVPGFYPEETNAAYKLLVDLQNVHDQYENAGDWPAELRVVAGKYGLTCGV